MNNEFIERRKSSTPENIPMATLVLSFDLISEIPYRIKLNMCNGESHWSSTVEKDMYGEIRTESLGIKSPCDCPDKTNRKDAFDIFKD